MFLRIPHSQFFLFLLVCTIVIINVLTSTVSVEPVHAFETESTYYFRHTMRSYMHEQGVNQNGELLLILRTAPPLAQSIIVKFTTWVTIFA